MNESVSNKIKVRELLAKYTFEMFNIENNHEGEITILNEDDIEDIISDMNVNIFQRAKMYIDESGMVVVEYPNNICRLESREEIKNENWKN